MTALDPLDVSARVVAEQLPEAVAAFLAGSVLTSRRTALSDLDIVVVLPGPPAPFRDTVRAYGWVVELFVHTPTSIAHYWQTDRAQWRCTLARMCAEGRLLVDVGGAGGRLQHEARALLEAGPPPVPAAELDRRRYMLTDSLDDLRGSRDPVEDVFIGRRRRGTGCPGPGWMAGIREVGAPDPGCAARRPRPSPGGRRPGTGPRRRQATPR